MLPSMYITQVEGCPELRHRTTIPRKTCEGGPYAQANVAPQYGVAPRYRQERGVRTRSLSANFTAVAPHALSPLRLADWVAP